jgi:hypothetical protein
LHFVFERRDSGLFAVVSATITLALVALLAFAASARAADQCSGERESVESQAEHEEESES